MYESTDDTLVYLENYEKIILHKSKFRQMWGTALSPSPILRKANHTLLNEKLVQKYSMWLSCTTTWASLVL